MRDAEFGLVNDVGNRLELFDEGGFIGVHILTSTTFSSMTLKKEAVKELHKWLGEYLEK